MLNTMVDEVRRMPVLLRFGAGVFAAAAWHNGDNFTHSVQVLKEGFPMVNLPPGAAGTISFTQPGEYDYICPTTPSR